MPDGLKPGALEPSTVVIASSKRAIVDHARTSGEADMTAAMPATRAAYRATRLARTSASAATHTIADTAASSGLTSGAPTASGNRNTSGDGT